MNAVVVVVAVFVAFVIIVVVVAVGGNVDSRKEKDCSLDLPFWFVKLAFLSYEGILRWSGRCSYHR